MSTSTTTAVHSMIPPRNSSTAFISSAVTTLCLSLTQRFMCAFVAAVFLSQMSLPACGSEKSYRTGKTPNRFLPILLSEAHCDNRTFSVIRPEVGCCHNWILLFDVVQQVLYGRENCEAILGAVVENVYITLDLRCCLVITALICQLPPLKPKISLICSLYCTGRNFIAQSIITSHEFSSTFRGSVIWLRRSWLLDRSK